MPVGQSSSKQKRAPGRPSGFTPKIGDEICALLAKGESLRAICRRASMPARITVAGWLQKNEEFAAQYARARDIGLDELADECFAIVDNKRGDPQRDRLRWDARRWHLSKMAPKRYGDKLTTEHVGKDGGPIVTAAISAEDAAKAYQEMLNGEQ